MILYSGRHGAGALRMRAGATIILAAALGGIRARLTAIFFTFGYGARAIWVCASLLNSFGHNVLLYVVTVFRCRKVALRRELGALR